MQALLLISDVLHITAGGTFQLAMHLSGTGTVSSTTPCGGFSFVGTATLAGTQVLSANILPCSQTGDLVYDFTAATNDSLTLTTLIRGRIGPWAQGTEASFDGTQTGIISITTLTPGAAFTTDTGFTYADPSATVPEPGTLALLGVGLAAASRRLRRRRG